MIDVQSTGTRRYTLCPPKTCEQVFDEYCLFTKIFGTIITKTIGY